MAQAAGHVGQGHPLSEQDRGRRVAQLVGVDPRGEPGEQGGPLDPPGEQAGWQGMGAVLGHPLLRPLAGATGLFELFDSVAFAVYVLYATREGGVLFGWRRLSPFTTFTRRWA